MKENIYIPERFRRVVLLHVVKNLLREVSNRPPLLLGIHGPSGDGKTYQCEYVLKEAEVKVFLISGGQLESAHAGNPALLIRNAYLEAGKAVEEGAVAAALVINDFDTGVGNWGDLYQYTVNRQTVFGELMHLVDYPTIVDGQKAKRIPIIMTGNDFTKLHEPLVRAGRMTAFEWKPTLEEKTKIIHPLFPELTIEECARLAAAFENEPLAFFYALRGSLIDDILYNQISRMGATRYMAFLKVGEAPQLEKLNYDHLLQAGKAFTESGQLVNHLRPVTKAQDWD